MSWMLELTHVNPKWLGVISVALPRPTGEPEPRHGQNPWQQRGEAPRSRRVTVGLAGAASRPGLGRARPATAADRGRAPGRRAASDGGSLPGPSDLPFTKPARVKASGLRIEGLCMTIEEQQSS